MKKIACLGILPLIFLLLMILPGSAEVSLSFSPENPRLGDYVDITVSSSREGAQGVRYELRLGEEVVFRTEKKNLDTHFTASFRPRSEGEYALTATLVYGKKDEEAASVVIPVSGVAPVQAGPDVVYSQKDGWWHSKVYSKKHKRSVEKAGCAIFALSHALQRMGFEGENLPPDVLATTYSGMYIENRGTDNERLLATAGEDFGFQSHHDLVESEAELTAWFQQGNLFSFMIVLGHIALADGLSEDGSKVHIVDSAPGATFERIKNASVYYQAEDGSFLEAKTPEELPGIRYFFETGEYGGMTYWLDLSYCAKQGMRPIRRPWLSLREQPDTIFPEWEYFGAMISKVTRDGENQRIPTRNLTWTTIGASSRQLVIVTGKKGVSFLNGNGAKKEGISKPIPWGTMLPALQISEKTCMVAYKDAFGFVDRAAVDLLPVAEEDFQTGLISVNGRTAGTTPVSVRRDASRKAKEIASWKPGTPVAVVQHVDGWYLLEGKGQRGWVPEKYVTLEGAE